MRIPIFKQRDYSCIVGVAIMCCLVSCKPKTVNQQQLETYVAQPKHGLVQTNDDKKVKVSVKYKPSDFLVDQHLQATSTVTPLTVDSLRKIYAKNLYFILHMTCQDQEVLTGLAGDAHTFSEMVEKLSFNMGSYVSLTTEKNDTLPMLDFVYPRMYGMSGSTDIMFAFENKIPPDSRELNFNLLEIGLGTGKMKFTFAVKDITSVPRLNFTKNKENNKKHDHTTNPK